MKFFKFVLFLGTLLCLFGGAYRLAYRAGFSAAEAGEEYDDTPNFRGIWWR